MNSIIDRAHGQCFAFPTNFHTTGTINSITEGFGAFAVGKVINGHLGLWMDGKKELLGRLVCYVRANGTSTGEFTIAFKSSRDDQAEGIGLSMLSEITTFSNRTFKYVESGVFKIYKKSNIDASKSNSIYLDRSWFIVGFRRITGDAADTIDIRGTQLFFYPK